jgi:hypothetical protein
MQLLCKSLPGEKAPLKYLHKLPPFLSPHSNEDVEMIFPRCFSPRAFPIFRPITGREMAPWSPNHYYSFWTIIVSSYFRSFRFNLQLRCCLNVFALEFLYDIIVKLIDVYEGVIIKIEDLTNLID